MNTAKPDAWFIAALVFVSVLALFAPKFAGMLVLLVAVYLAVGPLQGKIFNKA